MEIRRLTDQVAVSPQIQPEDVATLAAEGFAALICNRPNGEELGQPDFSAIDAAAQAAGLRTVWVPISGGMMGPKDVAAMAEALRDLPGPVLAYCRSGTRSTMLWAAAMAGTMPTDQIITAAAAAGYDVSGVLR